MLFDYQCNTCSKIKEVYVRPGDVDTYEFTCECGSPGHKLLSMPGFVSAQSPEARFFKGGIYTQLDTLNGIPKKRK